MRNSERLMEYIYLTWSVFMAYYWLVLFDNPAFPAVVPFALASLLLIGYALAFFRGRTAAKRWLLLGSTVFIVAFSIVAYAVQPACNCYRFSQTDLVPNGISLVMTVMIWLSLRKKRPAGS